jgi:hypothetical protein
MFENMCIEKSELANKIIAGKKVDHKKYGRGIIVGVKGVSKNVSDFSINILFENGLEKLMSLNIMLKQNLIQFIDPIDYEGLMELLSDVDIMCTKQLQIENQELEQKRAIERQKREDEKLRLREEAHIERMKDNFNRGTQGNIKLSSAAVEWIANNCSNIVAKLPSDLEKYFIKKFGSAASYSVIDMNKKTSGGFKMQYTFSFSIHFKSLDDRPTELDRFFTTKGKKINNVELVSSLILNYGFKFGKEQDLEEIKKYI